MSNPVCCFALGPNLILSNRRLVPLEQLPRGLAPECPPDHLSEILHELLADMPPKDRELIQAVYIDERPIQAIADETGQTYKAVESRLARLRHKLKEHLLKALRHEHKF